MRKELLKNFFFELFLDSSLKEDVSFLKSVDFLRKYDEICLKKIAGSLYKKNYLKGEVLYSKGEEVNIFFILKTGSVELYSENTIRTVPAGKSINIENVTSDKIHCSSARAAEDSLVYLIYRQEFEDLSAKKNASFFFCRIKNLLKKVKDVFKKQPRN